MSMTDKAIVTTGLSKRFGKHMAVDELHLEVPTGSVFGFLGRNGAGKTTTIKLLMNMVRPTAGKIEVLGLAPQKDERALKRRVGYVSDNPVMYEWMKVRELVWFTGKFYPRWNQQKVEDLLKQFGLDPEQKVKHLSRGMNAQVALALELGHDPELLILDEPATGLDALVRRGFLESIIQMIKEDGCTVFLSSHLVHEVERVADWIGLIENGKLVACKEINEIKQWIKKVLVRVADEQANFSQIDGLEVTQGEEPQRLLTVRNFGQEKIEAIKACGGQVVDVFDLSLEDSFIEYVKPYMKEEA